MMDIYQNNQRQAIPFAVAADFMLSIEPGESFNLVTPTGMLNVERTPDTFQIIDDGGAVCFEAEATNGKWQQHTPPPLEQVQRLNAARFYIERVSANHLKRLIAEHGAQRENNVAMLVGSDDPDVQRTINKAWPFDLTSIELEGDCYLVIASNHSRCMIILPRADTFIEREDRTHTPDAGEAHLITECEARGCVKLGKDQTDDAITKS